jgi:hypothetical protein
MTMAADGRPNPKQYNLQPSAFAYRHTSYRLPIRQQQPSILLNLQLIHWVKQSSLE